MENIIEKVKLQINEKIFLAVGQAVEKGLIPEIGIPDITIETPKDKAHGDFSSNIAMQITKLAQKPPRVIAQTLISLIETTGTYIDKVEIAGPGFINFYLNNQWLFDTLGTIQVEKSEYGRINLGRGQKVMVEFVSANPTGPLHMGNARGGALGDGIASVLSAAGYEVTREFYINDAGNQIEKFGQSLEARYIQAINGEDAVEFPEDGYQGEDIKEHVKHYIELNGDKLIEIESDERKRMLVDYALNKNLDRIKNDLSAYGINFDVWFSEQSLHDSGELDDTVQLLREKGLLYENEGATWFSSSSFGTEKDDVLIRANGIPTYYTADIAYHRNKFQKRCFDRVINLLGADHHGHVARMKAAVEAVGIDADRLDIVIFQLVRLFRDGELARMSKRTGKAISLIDLLDEVGRDAARFFFNMKASGSHLDFDLDLAVSQSNENPVYYVQYAHARICSMLKLLETEGITIGAADLTVLNQPEELELMKRLAELPEEIRISAQTLEPSRLTRYVMDVASLFHSFYNACRVRGEEDNLMRARLVLVNTTKIVISNVLKLLSISAPERMDKL